MSEEHSAPGGEVFATGLRPRSGKVVRFACGCSADDTRHLTFCFAVNAREAAHRAAVRASREAAKIAADPLLA